MTITIVDPIPAKLINGNPLTLYFAAGDVLYVPFITYGNTIADSETKRNAVTIIIPLAPYTARYANCVTSCQNVNTVASNPARTEMKITDTYGLWYFSSTAASFSGSILSKLQAKIDLVSIGKRIASIRIFQATPLIWTNAFSTGFPIIKPTQKNTEGGTGSCHGP